MSYGGVSNHKSVKSSWVDDDEDDIDDELFLKNSRKVSKVSSPLATNLLRMLS